MPAPHTLSRQLQHALGDVGADAMVDWMNQADAQDAAIRQGIGALRSDIKADTAEFRHRTETEFVTLRAEMRVQFAEIHTKFDAKFADINATLAIHEAASTKRHADFMKWTLGLWAVSLITMVAAIAGLARTLAKP
jgi:hypothetical protein